LRIYGRIIHFWWLYSLNWSTRQHTIKYKVTSFKIKEVLLLKRLIRPILVIFLIMSLIEENLHVFDVGGVKFCHKLLFGLCYVEELLKTKSSFTYYQNWGKPVSQALVLQSIYIFSDNYLDDILGYIQIQNLYVEKSEYKFYHNSCKYLPYVFQSSLLHYFLHTREESFFAAIRNRMHLSALAIKER